MSQAIFSDINPNTTSGTDLSTLLNGLKDAVASGMIGTSRPPNLQAGGSWVDNTDEASPNYLWRFKVWTGTSDIEVFKLNIQTNAASISGSDSTFEILKISADTAAPILKLIKRRIANSGQVLDGDSIGEIQFIGRANDGSSPVVSKIKAVASDDETAAANGGYLSFESVTDGGTTLSEMMRLKDSKLGIGTTNPSSTLHGVGSGITSGQVADNTTPAKFISEKSRIAGSGQVLALDEVASYEMKSTDDTGAKFVTSKMVSSATENHTATARGSNFSIQITKTGQSSLTEILKAEGDNLDLKTNTRLEAITLNKQDVASVAAITSLSADKALVNLTGSTATELQGINSSGLSKTLLIHNGSTGVLTVKHENAGASAANRMKLPNGRDITIKSDESIELFYSTTDSRWKLKSGSGSGSGGAAAVYPTVQSISSGGQFTVNTLDGVQVIRCEGDSGPQTAATDPFGTSGGWTDGTLVEIIGSDDTKTVTITHSDTAKGCVGNFSSIELAKYQTAKFRYINAIDRWVYVQ